MQTKETILKDVFGFETFRKPQSEVIDHIVNNNNQNGILVVMPTGGGKSLLYQLPPLLMDGLTIVISPLISLMKDQVDSLKAKNVPVEFYNSSLTSSEKRDIEHKLIYQDLKILYVAPERFGNETFINALKMTNKINLFAVDEAHCISTWGNDFRPSYRMIKNAISFLEPKQVIALTATATKRVQKDICDQLNIPQALKFIEGFYRPDLKINVNNCNSVSKITKIIAEVGANIRAGVKSGIIYCPTRKGAERIHKLLSDDGINSILYHAGLSDTVREQTQNRWFKNGGIVVATVAFGMGIDKSDVRFVIHAGMPSSVENYYQEIGRASRDGKGADCTVYFDGSTDVNLQRFFIEMSYPPIEKISTFWDWCCDTANNLDMILMTQKEMSDACSSFMKSHFVSGCVSKLKESGFIETLGNGRYKINRDKEFDMISFDFIEFDRKRRAKMDTLMEMTSFVNNDTTCRMLQILEYFDDYSRTKECGKCDVCVGKMLKNRPV